jgi:hypothetical protein
MVSLIIFILAMFNFCNVSTWLNNLNTNNLYVDVFIYTYPTNTPPIYLLF